MVRGHLLVTSCNPIGWRLPLSELPPMDEAESVEVLQKVSGIPPIRSAAELTQELGGLPLALVQAASYIKSRSKSYGAYLDLFRKRWRKLVGRPLPLDYPKCLATTWDLAIQRAQEEAGGALSLLNLCAFFATAPFRSRG